ARALFVIFALPASLLGASLRSSACRSVKSGRASSKPWAATPRPADETTSGRANSAWARRRQRHQLDVAEPHGLAFRLQGDVTEAELEGRAGLQQALRIRIRGIKLR